MKISRDLKMVIPVYGDNDEVRLTVFVSPLSRAAFENHYRIMARTWSDLNALGIEPAGLMCTASMAVKDATIALYGERDGPAKYEAFMAEIMNGVSAIINSSGKWSPVPYENAKGSGLLDDEDAGTVESLVVFFILASRMVDPKWGAVLNTAVALNYGAQFTSLKCMDYATSLQTLTVGGNSGGAPV